MARHDTPNGCAPPERARCRHAPPGDPARPRQGPRPPRAPACAPPALTLDVRRAGARRPRARRARRRRGAARPRRPARRTRGRRETRAALASALAAGLPALGLCLGAELLAEAAGGRTHPCPPEWGLAAVRLLPAAGGDALLGQLPSHLRGVPRPRLRRRAAGRRGGAGGDRRLPQAFRVGAHAWGVQFHPGRRRRRRRVLPTVAAASWRRPATRRRPR